MKNLTKIFKALSDQNRLRIIKMLEKNELCLCEISTILGLAYSTVSKHLSILRDAGMIMDHKDGKWVNFRLVKSPESLYVKEIQKLVGKWLSDDKTVISDNDKSKIVDRKIICGN